MNHYAAEISPDSEPQQNDSRTCSSVRIPPRHRKHPSLSTQMNISANEASNKSVKLHSQCSAPKSSRESNYSSNEIIENSECESPKSLLYSNIITNEYRDGESSQSSHTSTPSLCSPNDSLMSNYDYKLCINNMSMGYDQNVNNPHNQPMFMSTRQVLQQMLSLDQLIAANLIKTLIFDQKGSRYIQCLLNETNSKQEISSLIQHLVDLHKNHKSKLDLIRLACHQYGNYALSLIFKICQVSDLKVLLETFLYDSIMIIAESFYGSQFLIKILDILSLKNKDLLCELIKQFEEDIIVFSYYFKNRMNEYSSWIIQKMLELDLPHNAIEFIGEALKTHLFIYCDSNYGSKIVQKYILHYGSELNILQLFDDNDSYFKLSKSLYGNIIIQKIIEKDETYSNLKIYNRFRNKFICRIFMNGDKLMELSIDKYGSLLIETCLKVATKRQIGRFIGTVCNNDAFILSQIQNDEYGNFVAQRLLRTCMELKYESKAQCIIDNVNKHIINLAHFKKDGNGESYVDARNLRRCTPFITQCCECYLS